MQWNSKWDYHKNFKKKLNSSAPCRFISTKIASLIFLIIYILYLNYCAFSSTRNRDEIIIKILKKVLLQRHLLRNFHQKLIDINLFQDNTKHKISCNSVNQFSSYICHKILSHINRHADRRTFLCKICAFLVGISNYV